jgi:DNA-binding MarR family transcriptional regulator
MSERAEKLEALLPKLLRRMYSDAEAETEELSDLSLSQLRILRAVLDCPHTAGEVVELLGYSPSGLSQLTQRLVTAGLLVKSKDPHDARIKHLELSPKGRMLMEQRRTSRVEIAEHVLARLDESEQNELIRLLEKVSRVAGIESWTSPIERITA